MTGFRCGVCGKLHDHLPLDIGYRRPAPYFALPEEERASRVFETDDVCVIDGVTFMIRGVLDLPIAGADEQFGWGVWAEIDRQDYQRYLAVWGQDDEEQVPPFPGRLAGGIGAYPDSDRLAVSVKLRGDGQRPRFTVVSETHPLGVDQRAGITREKAHRFVEPFLEGAE